MLDPHGRILISRAEVARNAGVGRAAVSNWESRHADFPRSVRHNGREAFDATAVAAWLDGRIIPVNALRENEPEGLDYGSRFRSNLGLFGQDAVPPEREPGVEADTPGGRAARSLLARRGMLDSPETVIWLAIFLYARQRHPSEWAQIRENAFRAPDRWVFEDTWRSICEADPSFRDMSMPEPPVPASGSELVKLVDDAHELASAKAPHVGDRSPSAEIFTQLLDRSAEIQGRRAAEHFTPRAVVRLAVDTVVDASRRASSIYDPYCRTGEFLAEALSRLPPGPAGKVRVFGHNPNRTLWSLAQMNLRLHGVEPSIECSYWWNSHSTEKFDIVLANPPFNMRLPEGVVERGDWRYGVPPTRNGNYAWLQFIVSRLGKGGRAAVVMPGNAGFTTNRREQEIRAAMVEDGAVECVIGLPSNLFPGTGIPVSLWLLREPSGQPGDVLVIDVTDLGTTLNRTQQTLSDETGKRIVRALDRWRHGGNIDEPGFSRAVPIADLRAAGHKLSPGVHVAPRPSDRDPPVERIDDLLRRSALLVTQLRPAEDHVRWLVNQLEAHHANPTTVPLGELCGLKAGPSGSRLRSDLPPSDGVPVVLPRDLRDGEVVDHSGAGIPELTVSRFEGYRLEPGNVLVSRTVERGRVACVTEEQRGWLFSTGLIRLRVTSAEIIPDYLAHLLLSEACHEWMIRHTAGTVVGAITLPTLAKLPVPVVPLDEQEDLCRALNVVAEQARLYRRLASTTESLRQLLTNSLVAPPDEHPGAERTGT
ncbi:N-6 DNA methylase [Micromonospora chalcea]